MAFSKLFYGFRINIIVSFNPYFQSSASVNRWLTLIDGVAPLGGKVQLLICGGYISAEEKSRFGFEGKENFNKDVQAKK